jgi:predicted GTPase
LVDRPELILGHRALVIEDGPTLTHGEMKYGAGVIAAKRHGAREIVDPRPWLVGSLNETFEQYPAIGALLPAMGYSPEQIRDMENTINATECDVVVIATPIDLRRLMNIKHPSVMVGYELQEIGRPTLHDVISDKLAKLERARATRPAAKKKKAAARPTRSAAKKKKAATAARRSR